MGFEPLYFLAKEMCSPLHYMAQLSLLSDSNRRVQMKTDYKTVAVAAVPRRLTNTIVVYTSDFYCHRNSIQMINLYVKSYYAAKIAE